MMCERCGNEFNRGRIVKREDKEAGHVYRCR